MWDDEIDRLGAAVANGRERDGIEVRIGEGMADIERIVFVDVAVGGFGECVEDVGLKRVGGFHDEGIQIEPPKPSIISGMA